MSHSPVPSSALIWLALAASCSPEPSPPLPDARPPVILDNPAGSFAIVTKLDLQLPMIAADVIDPLVASTDGADDPTRYLVDHLVEALPDGTIKTLARHAAPLVASYLNERLIEIAPRFVAGIGALSLRTVRAATRFELVETLQIDRAGRALRTITGARFDVGTGPTSLPFTTGGLAEVTVATAVAIDRLGRLAIADHALRLPYGELLRLAVDEVVIPSVEPTAHDLATALGLLVDCQRLGDLVADKLGVGPPALYRAACRAAMVAIAGDLYRRIDRVAAASFELRLSGAAVGIDLDSDATMDEIRAGAWSGTLDYGSSHDPLPSATFHGTK